MSQGLQVTSRQGELEGLALTTAKIIPFPLTRRHCAELHAETRAHRDVCYCVRTYCPLQPVFAYALVGFKNGLLVLGQR